MTSVSPRYGLAYMATNTTNKETLFNEALAVLDALVMASAKSITTSAPPGSPTAGDLYIIPAGATGVWSGREDQLAIYGNGWIYVEPPLGALIYVEDESDYYQFGDVYGWEPYLLTLNDLDDLSDVNLTGQADHTLLIYDSGSGTYRPAALSGLTVYEESDGTFTIADVAKGFSVSDEGTLLASGVTSINFVGAEVTAYEESDGSITVSVTASGGGGGTDLTVSDDGSAINTATAEIDFTGAGVTVTETSNGVEVAISGNGGGSGSGLFVLADLGLSNGDFETGDMTDWTITTGTDTVIDGASTTYTSGTQYNGTYLLIGGESVNTQQALIEAYQDVDVSADANKNISYRLSALGSKNFGDDDFALISMEVRDASNNVLSEAEYRMTITTAGSEDMVCYANGHPDADHVRVYISIDRETGANNNAALDDVKLEGIQLQGAGISLEDETGTSYTLTNDDLVGGIYKTMTNAGTITISIPSGLTGTEPITFEQGGDGVLVFVEEDSGTELRLFSGTHDRTAGRHATVTLIPKGGDVFVLSGNTAAP